MDDDTHLCQDIALQHWVTGLSYDLFPPASSPLPYGNEEESNEEESVPIVCEHHIEHIMQCTGVDRYRAAKTLYFCEGQVGSAVTLIHRENRFVPPHDIAYLSHAAGVDEEEAEHCLRESAGHCGIALTALSLRYSHGEDEQDNTDAAPLFGTEDITYVMEEAEVSREVARAALLHCDGDVIAALLEITQEEEMKNDLFL